MTDHPLRDVGGTPGGLGDFLIGFAMPVLEDTCCQIK